ncbi:hypothetical protein ACFOY8_12010 [Thalassospira xianhensis]|uniref:Uncharacterized protein n=1 Tax=Thalassospira xianhensis MCCC 1A02616 TaxID=1177929 RepID=A0A367U8W9_9PROT|nr:hypothetical protein [Thalassospira xianhensis]RCK04153.1 hypothetical protein TH5_21495 [Thalassospira xianhensis MCCC 1A02616]
MTELKTQLTLSFESAEGTDEDEIQFFAESKKFDVTLDVDEYRRNSLAASYDAWRKDEIANAESEEYGVELAHIITPSAEMTTWDIYATLRINGAPYERAPEQDEDLDDDMMMSAMPGF